MFDLAFIASVRITRYLRFVYSIILLKIAPDGLLFREGVSESEELLFSSDCLKIILPFNYLRMELCSFIINFNLKLTNHSK